MNPCSPLKRRLFNIFILLLVCYACSTDGPLSVPSPPVEETSTSSWLRLQESTPVAHTTPLPPSEPTLLDGVYAKIDPSRPQAWLCRRCADYRPAGGVWRLQFDRGVMRILYSLTEWRSVASYSVAADRLWIFNDPYCPQVVGAYAWRLQEGRLHLQVIDDPCSIELRGMNLSAQAWESCELSDESEARSTAEIQTVACLDVIPAPIVETPLNVDVNVVVHSGDSRFFTRPPDLFAMANAAEESLPEGINLRSSPDSIPYGLNRILWWGGNWIETSTQLPFDAIGVQFLGDPQIGWARVLFDGVEVWRGDTSMIWSALGRHGGYVEVTSFAPGIHTIRVESLDFDFHPVTVASFGFSHEGGVESEDP